MYSDFSPIFFFQTVHNLFHFDSNLTPYTFPKSPTNWLGVMLVFKYWCANTGCELNMDFSFGLWYRDSKFKCSSYNMYLYFIPVTLPAARLSLKEGGRCVLAFPYLQFSFFFFYLKCPHIFSLQRKYAKIELTFIRGCLARRASRVKQLWWWGYNGTLWVTIK